MIRIKVDWTKENIDTIRKECSGLNCDDGFKYFHSALDEIEKLKEQNLRLEATLELAYQHYHKPRGNWHDMFKDNAVENMMRKLEANNSNDFDETRLEEINNLPSIPGGSLSNLEHDEKTKQELERVREIIQMMRE